MSARPAPIAGRVAAIALLGAAAIAAAPADKGRPGTKVDLIWAHPDFESFGIQRIAMLPCASYGGDLVSEKLTEGHLARALRAKGYRWITGTSSMTLLRAAAGGESLLSAVRADVLESPRLDSLTAPRICGALRCDAVLTARIDTWEQVKLEAYQSGAPSTTIQIRAAVVDSLGRLLWTAAGSETGQGPYYNPTANPYQTPGGGVGTQSLATVPPPPTFDDVLERLFIRWAERFPSLESGSP
jgi:hypothetical protein